MTARLTQLALLAGMTALVVLFAAGGPAAAEKPLAEDDTRSNRPLSRGARQPLVSLLCTGPEQGSMP